MSTWRPLLQLRHYMYEYPVQCVNLHIFNSLDISILRLTAGADSGGGGGGGGRTRRAPPWNTSKIFATPSAIEKIWFFGVKFSRLPLLGAIFLSAPPLTWNPGSAPEQWLIHPMIQLNKSSLVLNNSHLLWWLINKAYCIVLYLCSSSYEWIC